MVTIALKAEGVGLDVFATGEHHNPPFVPSSPTRMLAYIAARTERLVLSTSTTLITTNDPVYPWFGKDIRDGILLAVENYALLRRLWREDVVDWQGQGSSVHRRRATRRLRARSMACRFDNAPVYGHGRSLEDFAEQTQRAVSVVTAGLSTPSSTRLIADRLGEATTRSLRDLQMEPNVHVVELRAHGHALAASSRRSSTSCPTVHSRARRC